jgi:hypothetical protein
VLKVYKDQLAMMEQLVHKVLKAPRVFKVQLAAPELLVHKVRLAMME